jgi:hypothetical protein
MGPDPTLPANRHRRPRPPEPNADRDLVLDVDQPPARPGHDRAADVEHQQEAAVRLHHELTDFDAGARMAERPAEDPEPLGRHLPEPLTGREGVER